MCHHSQWESAKINIALKKLLTKIALKKFPRVSSGLVHISRVPAHTGVSGNEKADTLACTTKENIDLQIQSSRSELKSVINPKWQLGNILF